MPFHVPRDRVRDAGEDPVELAQHGPPVVDMPGDLFEQVEGEARHELTQLFVRNVP